MKKILKFILCAVLCALILCISVAAETPEFSLDLGREYKYFRVGDDLSAAAEITDMKKAELEKLFEEENLVMLALSEDNERQVRIAYYQNELSKKIGDLAAMDTEEVRELSKEIYPKTDSSNIDVVEIYSDKYMCFSELLEDSGGEYIAAQYITAVDGYFWHITTYGPPHNNVAVVLPFFTIGSDGTSTISKVLHIIGIVFAVLALSMLVLYFIEKRKETKIQASNEIENTDNREEKTE